MPEKNNHILPVNMDFKRSRFLVDLNSNSASPSFASLPGHQPRNIFKSDAKKLSLSKFKKTFSFQILALLLRLPYLVGWSLVVIVRFAYFLFKPSFRLFSAAFKRESKPGIASYLQIGNKESFSTRIRRFLGGKRHVSFYLPRFRLSLAKPALIFAVLALVVALPMKAFTVLGGAEGLKGRVLGVTGSAAKEMASASRSAASMDFIAADKHFESASESFFHAQKEIGDIGILLARFGALLPDERLKAASEAQAMLEAGELSAKIGQYLSESMASVDSAGVNPMIAINSLYYSGLKCQAIASELSGKIGDIDPENMPEKYREEFKLAQEKASYLPAVFGNMASILDLMRAMLGNEYDKRYLLVFQNNAEIRGGGGFIGSYALVDFRDGAIRKMEVPGGGSYDVDYGILEKIVSPRPLHLINPLWFFRDANWWPDWRMSARKVSELFQKSDRRTVDGVIGFTPAIAEDLLAITGEIRMEEYGVSIDSANFRAVVQEIAEERAVPGEKHEPKLIIGDLIEQIKIRLAEDLDKEKIWKIVEVLDRNLREKNIMIYLSDAELASRVAAFGWDGRLAETKGDYLMIANASVSGGKSDLKIRQSVEHAAEIGPDGSVIDTLRITRTHSAEKTDKFAGIRNNNWMRIYVPEGSELVEATGFDGIEDRFFEQPDASWKHDPDLAAEENAAIEPKSGTKIYREAGKTVFANWSVLDPGETDVLVLRYRLPFRLANQMEQGLLDQVRELFDKRPVDLRSYSLYWQKQPGSFGDAIATNLSYPGKFKPVWMTEGFGGESGTLSFAKNLDEDISVAALFEADISSDLHEK